MSMPHEIADTRDGILRAPDRKFSQEELTNAITRCACMYLLFERETETGVRAALGSLAQERHNEFHTKEGKKGDGSSFQECENEICKEVSEILENYQKPSVEFNQLTAEMMEDKYTLHILKGPRTVVVSLRDKSRLDIPPELPTPEEGTFLKVKA